jgi:hypothetical protein
MITNLISEFDVTYKDHEDTAHPSDWDLNEMLWLNFYESAEITKIEEVSK